MKPVSVQLGSILAAYLHRLKAGSVMIATDALNQTGAMLTRVLPRGKWLVVADPITQTIAGERVAAELARAGVAFESIVLTPVGIGGTLVADETGVNHLVSRIGASNPPVVAAVAVGSGTVNDLVKLATHKRGIPYAVVATAPSMNGYTSPIAAILCNGVKTVCDAQIASAVVADVGLLAAAPARMIAAGYGDLLSKPVSNADWWLSHALTGSKYCADVMRLVEEGNGLLAGVGAGLQARDPEAVGRLTGALLLSGYAMALAGTSAPASGGEHLISHYLDMTHYALGEPNDLHGCQVGVATMVTASLYERLLDWDPASLDVEQRVAALEPWGAYEKRLTHEFGPLASAVLPHAQAGYPDVDTLRVRLTRVKLDWPALAKRLRQGLRPAAAVLADLKAAGCPRSFAQIGCTPERARRATLLSKDIRPRYTVLHFCWELGVLEPWAGEILCRLA